MRSKAVVCLGICLVTSVAWAATEAPVAVSPGSAARVSPIADRCPTFSWGGVVGAAGYELVVYRVADDGAAVEVLRETFQGSVYSWTPALDRCLAAGEQYAWSVRTLGRRGASEWSAPALLRVASGPGEAEFLEALAVVRQYLAANPRAAESPAERTGTSKDEAARPAAPATPTPRAPAATDLSVAGGVEAASFTGDGSTLTGLAPANLAPGTAAIDITGTAANVTGTVAVDHGGTGATSAAQACLNLGAATTTQLTAHESSDDHAATYVNATGDTMTGALTAQSLMTTSAGPSSLDVAGGINAGSANVNVIDTTGKIPGLSSTYLASLDGSALTGVAAATAAALAANGANCPPGMVAAGVNAAGAAECIADADTLGGLSCSNGQVAKWNSGSSTWNCGADSGAVNQPAGDGYFSGDLRIDGDLGIGTDPLPGTERNIYMYDGGIYSDPSLYISGHNSGFIRLQRRRTDSSDFYIRAGCGSVNCTNDFSITHSTAGTCIAIRDGCDVDIPKLEVDTFKTNPTDSPGTCGGSTEGNLYYDDSLSEPCFCNGSAWTQFDGGGSC